jgi:hypothetical protein
MTIRRIAGVVLLASLAFAAFSLISFMNEGPFRPIEPRLALERLGISGLPLPEQAYQYTGKDFGIWVRWRVAPEALDGFLAKTGLKEVIGNSHDNQTAIMIGEMQGMNEFAKETSPFYPPALSVRSFGTKKFKFPNYISILIGEDRSPGAPAALSVFIFKNFWRDE